MTRPRDGSAIPRSSMKSAASSSGSCADLRLDLAGQRRHVGLRLARTVRDPPPPASRPRRAAPRRCSAPPAPASGSGTDSRAAGSSSSSVRPNERSGPAVRQVRLEALQQDLLLALGLLALRRRAVAARVRSFSSRFSTTVRSATVNSRSSSSTSRHGSAGPLGAPVVEGAGHVQQRIGVADQGEHVGVDRPLASRAGRDGDVDVGDVGGDRLLAA